MLKDSRATDRDRSIIAGHYIFSKPECIDIKKEAQAILRKKNIDIESIEKFCKKSNLSLHVKF